MRDGNSKTNRSRVALLAEGVDRNLRKQALIHIQCESPSSQRAWIEMRDGNSKTNRSRVALLAEGVDRNHSIPIMEPTGNGRPPRRGRG